MADLFRREQLGNTRRPCQLLRCRRTNCTKSSNFQNNSRNTFSKNHAPVPRLYLLSSFSPLYCRGDVRLNGRYSPLKSSSQPQCSPFRHARNSNVHPIVNAIQEWPCLSSLTDCPSDALRDLHLPEPRLYGEARVLLA